MVDALLPDELSAAHGYYASSKLLNVCVQGWFDEFSDSQKVRKFFDEEMLPLVNCLDGAIAKHTVEVGGTVFSGHGNSIGCIGSLRGEPNSFVGLRYRYPGYISASEDIWVANKFLCNNLSKSDCPVRLEIELIPGQKVLPLTTATGQGAEMEFLLPRGSEFTITSAAMTAVEGVGNPVLNLKLRPPVFVKG